jgi:hypothetical protein
MTSSDWQRILRVALPGVIALVASAVAILLFTSGPQGPQSSPGTAQGLQSSPGAGAALQSSPPGTAQGLQSSPGAGTAQGLAGAGPGPQSSPGTAQGPQSSPPGAAQGLTPPSPAQLSIIGDQIKGHLAFRSPQEMKVGVDQWLEARVALGENPLPRLTQDLAGNGPIRTPALSLPLAATPTVNVALEGDKAAFKIERVLPASSETGEQAVSTDRIPNWVWQVTPRQSGQHLLFLCVHADVGGISVPVGDCFIRSPITVRANTAYAVEQLLGNNWKWFIGTLGLGLLGFLSGAGLLGLRRSGEAKESPTTPNRPRLEVPSHHIVLARRQRTGLHPLRPPPGRSMHAVPRRSNVSRESGERADRRPSPSLALPKRGGGLGTGEDQQPRSPESNRAEPPPDS